MNVISSPQGIKKHEMHSHDVKTKHSNSSQPGYKR